MKNRKDGVIAAIHSALIPHAVQASAWLIGPDPSKMIVVVGAAVENFAEEDGAPTIEFFPIVADLASGFEPRPATESAPSPTGVLNPHNPKKLLR